MPHGRGGEGRPCSLFSLALSVLLSPRFKSRGTVWAAFSVPARNDARRVLSFVEGDLQELALQASETFFCSSGVLAFEWSFFFALFDRIHVSPFLFFFFYFSFVLSHPLRLDKFF